MSETIDQLDGVPITHAELTIRTTGTPDDTLRMHVVTAGPTDGTPVILLHGFPDFWYGWRRQIPALARAGYRVIVPDQRGYAGTAKPKGVRAYHLDHLVADVAGLQDALCGGAPTHIVGHDWGGGVAWAFATARPDRTRTLTVANCPRPRVLMQQVFGGNLQQLAKSWYILFFQLPWLPVRLLAGGGVEKLLGELDRRAPDVFPADVKARYGEAATPAAMSAALNWYRAALRDAGPDGPVTPPTLVLWGTHDVALGTELVEPSLEACTDGRVQWLDDITHWSPHQAYDAVNAALLDHLANHGGPDPRVYKIVDATWDDTPDPWPGSPDDLRDGFVHLSAAHQVEGTLAKHFAGRDDLSVLAVDPAKLPAGALRWEESRGGKRFPHLYVPLPRSAIVGRERVSP